MGGRSICVASSDLSDYERQNGKVKLLSAISVIMRQTFGL